LSTIGLRIGWLLLAAMMWSPAAGSEKISPVQPAEVAMHLQALLPTRFLLLGEIHNIPEQLRLHAAVVRELASQGRLHALVLEMAHAGQDTRQLTAQASESSVQAALGWNDGAWPWRQYGPLVMAAVQSGVPVFGGIPPRTTHASTMANATLDARLSASQFENLQGLIHRAHCELLPRSQWPGMARIQIARDLSMAQTLWAASAPGQTTVLVTGQQHVRRDRGVPLHLNNMPGVVLKPADLRVVVMQAANGEPVADIRREFSPDAVWITPPGPEQDHCADLRARFGPRNSATAR
jgi:uncharacterized iron-regulated protein